MEIKETYNSLQQEVDVKTKKLKKVSPTLLGGLGRVGQCGKGCFVLVDGLCGQAVSARWGVWCSWCCCCVCGVAVVVEDKFRSPYFSKDVSVPRAALSIPTEVHPHTGSFHIRMSMMRLLSVCVCVRERESVRVRDRVCVRERVCV